MVSNQSYNKLAYIHSEQERQLVAHRVKIIHLFWKGSWEESQALQRARWKETFSTVSLGTVTSNFEQNFLLLK